MHTNDYDHQVMPRSVIVESTHPKFNCRRVSVLGYTCDRWLSLILAARREDSDLYPVLDRRVPFIHKPKHRESDRLCTRPLNTPVDRCSTAGTGAF